MSTNKDFDKLSAAMDSGNFEELDRLMAAEEEVEEETDEVVDEAPLLPEPEVETPDEDAADDKSESSPEVDNDVDDEEETNTEAAVPAASTAKDTEQELQRLRSDAGRVPFIQRKMAELERELRAYKARDAQPTPSNGGKQDLKDITLDEETQREIDELREVDPTLAKTLERVAKTAIATANARVDHAVTTMTQADQEQDDFNFLMEQKSELVREIPQADAIFATPEWKQWKDTLTPGQRALAESSYASEVKQAIYAFAAVMQQQQPTKVVETPVPENTKLREDRARKVGTSAEVKTSAAKKAVDLDEDAYFAEQYDKIGKANHILK